MKQTRRDVHAEAMRVMVIGHVKKILPHLKAAEGMMAGLAPLMQERAAV